MIDFTAIKQYFINQTRLLLPPFLQIGYAEDIDAFCLLDQRSLIYSHDEFNSLVNELGKFYQAVTPQDIIDTNNDTISQLHNHNSQEIKVKKNEVQRCIYLISKKNGDCKIGVTSNLKSRLSQIKTIEPQIELLHTFEADDAYEAEAIWHHIFRSQCIGGEWFKLSDEDIINIKSVIEYKDSQFIKEPQ